MMQFLRKNKTEKALSSVDANRGGWWPFIKEAFTGAWQQNKEVRAADVRDFFAIYSCITLISADISKMAAEVKLTDSDGVLTVVKNNISTLLGKPNRYQNSVQFRQWWTHSKLSHGNTYALKQRDKSGNIEALYILDPSKVQVLIADDGSVYYELNTDTLNTLQEDRIVVSASEIIHDRYQPQFHPLIGVSPVYAAALAGALGKKIQEDSLNFVSNGANLSGVLSAPGAISKDTAESLSSHWNKNYTGAGAGRVAVVGDGLKFSPMRASGVDSQIVEQLKLSSEIVASCFHVPPFKIGMGVAPAKPQEGNLIYYSDCLQVLIEEFEACLDAGLEMKPGMRIELDTDDLMRMDLATMFDTYSKGIGGSVTTPNEARKKMGFKPLEGGDSIYMQQQNYSLEALAKRDALDDPFGTAVALPVPEAKPQKEDQESMSSEKFLEIVQKQWAAI